MAEERVGCDRVGVLQVVQAFVRQAMDFVEETPDREIKVELIKTLQTVTEGKVRFAHTPPPPVT